ncbi:hypothetical protein D4764_06G0003760, partial [Takifugu flavidus]
MTQESSRGKALSNIAWKRKSEWFHMTSTRGERRADGHRTMAGGTRHW